MAGPYTIPEAIPNEGYPPGDFNAARAAILDIYSERTGGTFFEGVHAGGGTVSSSGFNTYPINTIETNIGGGSFNTSTFIYTIPSTGLYDCQATIRINDNSASRNVGIGIGEVNEDAPHFLWNQMGQQGADSTPTQRSGKQYRRVTRFTVGAQVRLYIYSEASDFPVSAGSLMIMRVGE